MSPGHSACRGALYSARTVWNPAASAPAMISTPPPQYVWDQGRQSSTWPRPRNLRARTCTRMHARAHARRQARRVGSSVTDPFFSVAPLPVTTTAQQSTDEVRGFFLALAAYAHHAPCRPPALPRHQVRSAAASEGAIHLQHTHTGAERRRWSIAEPWFQMRSAPLSTV